MVKLAGEPSLVDEQLDQRGIARDVGQQPLERDRTADPDAALLGAVHRGHSTLSEALVHEVRSELLERIAHPLSVTRPAPGVG